MAGPRDDVLEALGKCARVADDKARLACYDALAPQLRDALNLPPASLSHPPTKEEQESWFGFNLDNIFGTGPAQQTTPEKFGADTLPPPPPPPATAPAATAPGAVASASAVPAAAPPPAEPVELDSITSGVTEYSVNPFGKFIVFLDNGQVWHQLEGDSEVAHFRKNPKDNTVKIERGALGSYNLYINDSVKIYKVTRIK